MIAVSGSVTKPESTHIHTQRGRVLHVDMLPANADGVVSVSAVADRAKFDPFFYRRWLTG